MPKKIYESKNIVPTFLYCKQLKQGRTFVSLLVEKQRQFIYSFLTATVVILSYMYLDLPIATYCYELKDTLVDHFFRYITLMGNSLPYILISIMGYLFFRYYQYNKRKANGFVFIFLAVIISGVVTDIIKWIMGRYRPHEYFNDNLYGFDFFHTKGPYTSFPSGHTTTAFAMAMILSFLFPRLKWIWLFFAILIGLSRIVLAQHYVSDVVFGAYVGIVTVMLIISNQKSLEIYLDKY